MLPSTLPQQTSTSNEAEASKASFEAMLDIALSKRGTFGNIHIPSPCCLQMVDPAKDPVESVKLVESSKSS